jgi:hypothetical protein
VFWFSLQILPKTFLILRRIQRGIVINVKTSLCKVPVIPVGVYWNSNFLDRFSKKAQISSFITIRQVGAEWWEMDGHDSLFAILWTHLNFSFIPSYLAQCFKICWWRKYFFIQNDFLPPFGLCGSWRLHHSPAFPPLMPMLLFAFIVRVGKKAVYCSDRLEEGRR